MKLSLGAQAWTCHTLSVSTRAVPLWRLLWDPWTTLCALMALKSCCKELVLRSSWCALLRPLFTINAFQIIMAEQHGERIPIKNSMMC